MRSGGTNILRRGVPALEAGNVLEAGNKKDAAEAGVSRRIEVTVERETVTMLVRAQPGGTRSMNQENAAEAAGENKTPASEPAKLPLPQARQKEIRRSI
jgi:hypothetical protein